MAAATTPSREPVEPSLGQVVLYHVSDGDDAAERTAFPLSSHMDTFLPGPIPLRHSDT